MKKKWLKTQCSKNEDHGLQANHFMAEVSLGSKDTAGGDCSHKIKRGLPLGWKAMTTLDSILKSQRHHFASKGQYSQS